MKKKLYCVFVSFFLFSFLFAENFGLVLSGGGAKGAYEVGVWKALEDFGITSDVKIISGTSVGALNAALFACVESSDAEKLWREQVGYSSFLMPDTSTFSEVASFAVRSAKNNLGKKNMEEDPYGFEDRFSPRESELLRELLDGVTFIADTGIGFARGTVKYLSDYIFSTAHSDGIFERSCLEEILENYISLEKLDKSQIDVYATAVAKDGFLLLNTLDWLLGTDNVHYFKLNEQLNDSNVNSILMASSSFPLVYESTFLPTSVIENGVHVEYECEYIDGGFESVGGKNTPIKPVASALNVDTIIVVYLKSEEELNETYTNTWISDSEANGKKMIEIVPSKALGDLVEGTMNFDPENISELIDLGYQDTCTLLLTEGYKKQNRLQKFIKNIF